MREEYQSLKASEAKRGFHRSSWEVERDALFIRFATERMGLDRIVVI